MTPAYVYIMQSQRNSRYYIGHTVDLARRLRDHNADKVKATRHLRPWTLIHAEELTNATAARQREWYLKRLKSRRALEAIMDSALVDPPPSLC